MNRFRRLVDQYKKIGRFTDILEYFSTREWTFCNRNVRGLWDKLNDDDRTIFPFDIKQMHWEEYLDTYHKGILKFLLKEGADKLPAAKKRLRGYVSGGVDDNDVQTQRIIFTRAGV